MTNNIQTTISAAIAYIESVVAVPPPDGVPDAALAARTLRELREYECGLVCGWTQDDIRRLMEVQYGLRPTDDGVAVVVADCAPNFTPAGEVGKASIEFAIETKLKGKVKHE